MSDAKPNLEEFLFEAALEKGTPAERDAFLEGVCRDNPALRARLNVLLEGHYQAEGFLTQVPEPERPSSAAPPVEEPSTRMIGRYKLLQKLGEGGFGEVWMAEQKEPVKRRVALKIIKLGMDSKQVVARFEAERQALAMMDHPNIAKIFDAGTTESPLTPSLSPDGGEGARRAGEGVLGPGRPYFVMELVRGIKITEYCEKQKLSTRERLELFIKVCQAVQHAHQKAVIHRDLKPSNILVTLHDGVPVPKVIDFGIAKAMQTELTDKTLFTQFEQFIGTPAYVSPEQAEMSGLDIDTRSDIYSLGVLLYELLVGQTPFDAKEMTMGGLEAMRQIIREKEPVKPSTRLRTFSSQDLTTTAECQRTDGGHLTNLIRGDLDWIVMKCLEKDRTRRYETANGLAMDLQRHLNNEPVVARPPSSAYRFQKLVRRNQLAFAAAGAVACALFLGIIATTWQAVRATQAKQQALAAQTSEKVQRQKAEANAEKAVAAQKAEAAEALIARQRAYASDMNVAQQALDGNNLGRALKLLNRERPEPGQTDLRGWEWRYLWGQTRSDALFTWCRESGEINSLAVSSHGHWLAIGVYHRGGLAIWNLRTRQEVVSPATNEMDVRAAFSPTAPVVAFTSENIPASGKPQFTLHLWNVATRQMVAEEPLDARCVGLAFSQDGQKLLTSTIKGHITLWNAHDGTQVTNYASRQGWAGPFRTPFAATSDLHLAAYGLPWQQIRVVDLRNGNVLWTRVASKAIITALAFSPDGKTLASAAGFGEKDILLWDVATGKEIGRLEGHASSVSSLVFWPDGKKLASSSGDQTIRIWDVARRKCLDVLRGNRQAVYRLALLPDDKTLVSGCRDGTVCFWDTSVPHPRQARLTLPARVYAWCFEPDSQSLLTVGPSGVTRWTGTNFQQCEPLPELGTHFNSDPRYDVFSHGGRFLASGSTNGDIQVWDVSRRVLWRQLANSAGMEPLRFVASGKKLVTVTLSTPSSVCEWDLTTGRETQSWPAPEAYWRANAFSPDEQLCVLLGGDGDVIGRNFTEEKNVKLPLDVLDASGAAFSPDGKLFAVASSSGYAEVWETTTWNEEKTLRGFPHCPYSVAFSPDGKRLATGGASPDDAVRLWDVGSWQNVFTLQGEGLAFHAAFSPDGNIIGALAEGNLNLWCAPSWKAIHAAEAKNPRSPGYGATAKTQAPQP